MSVDVVVINFVQYRLAGSALKADGDVADWFGALLFELAERHGIKLAEARVRIYAADLAEFEPAQVVAAARRASREGSGFFPHSAEIRKALVGSADDAALLAWNGLERAAEQVGSYRSLEIEDPVTAAALLATFGAWSAFCATPAGPALLVKRQEFLAAYRRAQRERPSGAQPVRCAGLLEVGLARLTAGGEIVHRRERPASLSAGAEVNRLTAGGGGDTDGEDEAQ